MTPILAHDDGTMLMFVLFTPWPWITVFTVANGLIWRWALRRIKALTS